MTRLLPDGHGGQEDEPNQAEGKDGYWEGNL